MMKCRDGHESTESDYCSVCGAAMAAPRSVQARDPVSAGPGVAASASGETCPACGEPRADAEARYCEVCRYDFVKRAAGPPPAGRPAAPSAPRPAAPPLVPVAPATRWELVLTVDPSLDTEPDPGSPPPTDEPERTFAIELSEMLVGRRDDKQNIRPAVPLNDPGASRRHAKFLLDKDGTVRLQDLASMNGTKLNGQDVVSGSVQALKEGDEVTLGRWTRIRLRRHA
jgi:FHA domain-containing protein